MSRPGRLSLIVIGIAIVLIAAAGVYVTRWLPGTIQNLIADRGPGAGVGAVALDGTALRLGDVRFTAGGSRSTRIEAASVRVNPAFTSLLDDTVRITSVVIEQPRLRREPKPDVTPSSSSVSPAAAADENGNTGAAATKSRSGVDRRALLIERLEVVDGTGEYVVDRPGAEGAIIALSDINLRAENIHLPNQPGPVPVDLSFAVDAVQPGRGEVRGWADRVARSAALTLNLRDVPVALAEPWYRDDDTTVAVTAGSFAVEASVAIDEGSYRVPGQVVLRGLRFDRDQGEFLGVPVHLLRRYFEQHDDTLTLPFELSGHLDGDRDYRRQIAAAVTAGLVQVVGVETARPVLDKLQAGDLQGARDALRALKEQLRAAE